MSAVPRLTRIDFSPAVGMYSALTRRWESNDHYEQFDHSDSDHQYRDCYRIDNRANAAFVYT
jgi:hypothetical protein